jgi:hypothetical protein
MSAGCAPLQQQWQRGWQQEQRQQQGEWQRGQQQQCESQDASLKWAPEPWGSRTLPQWEQDCVTAVLLALHSPMQYSSTLTHANVVHRHSVLEALLAVVPRDGAAPEHQVAAQPGQHLRDMGTVLQYVRAVH